MNIVKYPAPILRSVVSDLSDPSSFRLTLKNIADDMLSLMRKSNGVGLAAPQVGLSIRMWVADLSIGPIVATNPRITLLGQTENGEEGCLSLPGISANKLRHQEVSMEYTGIDGVAKVLRLVGLDARVAQHETDHLDGKLITDGVDTGKFVARFQEGNKDFIAWFIENRSRLAADFHVDAVSIDLGYPAVLYHVGKNMVRFGL